MPGTDNQSWAQPDQWLEQMGTAYGCLGPAKHTLAEPSTPQKALFPLFDLVFMGEEGGSQLQAMKM